MIKIKRLPILSLLLILFPLIVLGQQTSSVTGVVTDATGAIIRGADVKLTDTKTAKEQSTKTNEQGIYSFLKVAPGFGYTLTFTSGGFDTLEIKNVSLGVGVTETHNAQLAVGKVSNTVSVTSSEGATLNTTDATIGNVIDARRLHELPLQIRESPAGLLGLQPGVVGNNVGTTADNLVGSVTGARADQGNITIDGIDANDQATNGAFATVGNAPIDAIQEFRTVSANPGAGEGRSSGGQIMLVTKGGSNQFHGNLREYNRTALTAANNFFNNRTVDPNTGQGIARPQLTRNQFGGNIGGPVRLPRFNGKDKLFFFFDYEGRRDAQGVSYLRTVPLDHFRNGGLAYLNSTPGCSPNARLDTNPECITILSSAQVAGIDPQGVGANQPLLNFVNGRYPQANDLTAGDGINTGGFRFNSPSRRSTNTYTSRIDLNATDKQKVFGRFNIARSVRTDTNNTVAQQFPGDPESGQIVQRDFAFVGGHTWNISSSLVNNATFGITRSGLDFAAPFAPVSPNIFSFGPLSDPYADISTQNRRVPTPTIRDDFNWLKGSHTMSFGVSIKPIRLQNTLVNDFNFATIGIGGLTGSLAPGLRPVDILQDDNLVAVGNYDAALPFLLGRYASINTNYNYDIAGNALPAASGKVRDYRYNEFELYAQDSWKVRNDLTINYGVRWHYYPAPYEVNGFQTGTNADLGAFFAQRVQNGANGISGPGSEPLFSYDLIGRANNARDFYVADKNNFAPRLSFSWNPSFRNGLLGKAFGDRKTVIRGGGSVVYDRTGGALTFLTDQFTFIFDNTVNGLFGGGAPSDALATDPRFTGINTIPNPNMPSTITRPVTPFIDPNGIPIGNVSSQGVYAVDQNYRTPYSITYSFGFQRELPQNFILEMSYVGRQARKLFGQGDVAQIVDFVDPASGQSMVSAFNAVQSQLQAGGTGLLTAQPWIENQINSALGGPTCNDLVGLNCTNVLTQIFGLDPLLARGDLADTIQFLYAQGLLNPNVGLSGQFSTNAYVGNFGSSSYNGMLMTLRRRFSQGLQFDFNYSLSRSIDNQSSITNTTFNGLICDFRNLRACRGNSDFDIRHLMNVNGIYELPFGRGKAIGGNARGLLNTLIGGWQVGGIFSYRSGLPFNAITDAFSVGFFTQSPVALSSADTSALQQNINDSDDGTIQFFADSAAASSAMRAPQHGESGNRNVLRGPSFWNVDTSVLKNFQMPWSESQKLQFRWEAYNAFNNNSFGLPNNNLRSASFGRITGSAGTPREMQFALRYEF